jgi:hypothetical protein
MKRKNVASEIVEAMREAAAIAKGEAKPAALRVFPLPRDVDVGAARPATKSSKLQRFA